MLFLDNRLVDQTEQMFRRIRGCLEEKQKKNKRVTIIDGLFYSRSAD